MIGVELSSMCRAFQRWRKYFNSILPTCCIACMVREVVVHYTAFVIGVARLALLLQLIAVPKYFVWARASPARCLKAPMLWHLGIAACLALRRVRVQCCDKIIKRLLCTLSTTWFRGRAKPGAMLSEWPPSLLSEPNSVSLSLLQCRMRSCWPGRRHAALLQPAKVVFTHTPQILLIASGFAFGLTYGHVVLHGRLDADRA